MGGSQGVAASEEEFVKASYPHWAACRGVSCHNLVINTFINKFKAHTQPTGPGRLNSMHTDGIS